MIALDKQAHFWAGAAIAAAFAAYGLAPWLAFVIAAVIGALKEVWDKVSGTGTMDKLDFMVTALGAAVILPLEVI